MKLDISLGTIDSELFLKRMTLKYGQKKVITPAKTSFSGVQGVSKINEIYKKIGLTKIDSCKSDTEKSGKLCSRIEAEKVADAINILIINYPDLHFPDGIQMEYLSAIQHPNSDVIVTPTWSEIVKIKTGSELVDVYNRLTNKYIEQIEVLNNKTILGMLSARIPFESLEKIIENYLKHDITSFVIDFDRRSMDTDKAWTRQLMVILEKTAY